MKKQRGFKLPKYMIRAVCICNLLTLLPAASVRAYTLPDVTADETAEVSENVEEIDNGILAEPEESSDTTVNETEAITETEGISDNAPALNAAQEDNSASELPVSYDFNAALYDNPAVSEGETPGGEYPGVYEVKIDPNSEEQENAPTIGIPSIADGNLDKPTTESPAIIQGAAVGYEEKTGPVEYETIKERVEPYTDFKYTIIDEQGQDGTIHKKPTGFDGTYVIVRLDVSEFFKEAAETVTEKYLHIKQENNYALIPGMGMMDNDHAFADQMGNKTGAYLLSDLLDNSGKDTETPYVDVLLFASGKIAAGADAGKEDMPNGDVPIHFYVDDTADYNPDLKYDPQSTDPNHHEQCLNKFYDAGKAIAGTISNFLIKGSDLALETAVENSGGENKDSGTTYWSLKKAIEDPYYDLPEDSSPEDPDCGRTVKLISEVPIIDGLDFHGTDEDNLRKRTLDVNSFDIQVANNTTPDESTYTAGITLENAWLKIEDKSNTTGAEMAIGNNAKLIIESGAKLIIDETCQLEIEWDGGTTTPAEGEQTPPPSDTLNNGILDLRAGGEIENNGIITIEGTEGKPYAPETGQQAIDSEKGYGELTIEEGATITNNGCFVIYGILYNLGTLINNGKYDDVITSYDPDKGNYDYHKGIQISWKDDVTQNNVFPGILYNGKDKDGTINKDALLVNNGDILLNPGVLENYGLLKNSSSANVYLAAATEGLKPIEPTPEAPTVETVRFTIDPPKASVFTNYGTVINDGNIVPASVELRDNGSFGKLTTPGEHPELFDFRNEGTVINNGYIYGWPQKQEENNEENNNEESKEENKKEKENAADHSSYPATEKAFSWSTGDPAGQKAFLYLTAMLTALCGLALVCRNRFRDEKY